MENRRVIYFYENLGLIPLDVRIYNKIYDWRQLLEAKDHKPNKELHTHLMGGLALNWLELGYRVFIVKPLGYSYVLQ